MNRALINRATPDSGMRPIEAPFFDTACLAGRPVSRATPVAACPSTSLASDPYLARHVNRHLLPRRPSSGMVVVLDPADQKQ